MVDLFRSIASKYKVKLVGENVKLIDDNTTIDQIKKDGVGYDEVWLFRANVNEEGDIINYENISKIT